MKAASGAVRTWVTAVSANSSVALRTDASAAKKRLTGNGRRFEN